VKKRSDNTLDSDTTKTISDKTEVNAPESIVTPEVKKQHLSVNPLLRQKTGKNKGRSSNGGDG